MAWAETMFIIQKFYDAVEVDRRITEVENKAPIIAKSINGLPKLPIDMSVGKMTPGTLWFIQDDNIPTRISGVSVLQEDHSFSEAIPFQIDLNNMPLDEDIKQIASSMGLTSNNYYDIIKSMLEILRSVPVDKGGTGITSIGNNEVLVGGEGNTFKTVGIDNAPTAGSENFITSGAIYDAIGNIDTSGSVPINHASSNITYGVGTSGNYGHLKISDSYSATSQDTAFSQKGANSLYTTLNNSINSLNNSMSGKAPTDHADSNTTYGVGSNSEYGHLKISDIYSPSSAVSDTALSQSGAKSMYTSLNNSISSINTSISSINTSLSGKAPTNHAVNASTYGLGSSSVYGHVKLTDSHSSTTANTALSAKGAKDLYDTLNTSIGGKAPTNHANSGTTYGRASSSLYGHVRIVDDYNNAASGYESYTAVSAAGIKTLMAEGGGGVNISVTNNSDGTQTLVIN